MPMIDDRGRVFGKINLIDALVGIFVVLLIPLAYGTLLLFRVPDPRITAIEPTQLVAHSKVMLRVVGENFEYFLQARIGPFDAPFLVESPTVGAIRMPDLDVGTYDVALYDQARELVRLPAALKVVPPSPPARSESGIPIELQAVGAFVAIDSKVAKQIRVGTTFSAGNAGRPVAEVLALQTPEPWLRRVRVSPTAFATWRVVGELRLPAVVRLSCSVAKVDDYCLFGDAVVALGNTLRLPLASSEPVDFLIEEVRSVDAPPAFD